MLKIYGRNRSINVRKVLWACDEIGIAYDRIDIPTETKSTRDPAYLALNPNGLIPVIQDGDFVMWESNAICRYLAMKHGRTDLLPADPVGRARVEQWMDWQATDLNAAWRYAFLALVRNTPPNPDQERLAASIESWNRLMGILDGQLRKTGGHAAGADFTVADIVIGLTVNRWLMTPIERPDYPAVAAYFQRLSARPAFAAHGGSAFP